VRCFGDLCFDSRLVEAAGPLSKDDLANLGRRAFVVAVRAEAVEDWRYLLQAMLFAYKYRGPARDPRISALMYLTTSDSIREAERASPIGLTRFVLGALGPRGDVEAELGGVGEPYYPLAEDYDPWKIIKFALSRLT
jgi:hypothetical protein